ncbi:DNA ligase-1 [Paucibacter oligotrophus]|uniref:DNA ligase-1 n=1 Tax=Roseateles oligotrophus TaxID=1769250 RepID=A0A840L7H6_9BURK|nr:DNA ligase [Roseateles oligotrophus]MBB4844006.1 DNA ligase-1 [Roseateles oligotrophus]
MNKRQVLQALAAWSSGASAFWAAPGLAAKPRDAAAPALLLARNAPRDLATLRLGDYLVSEKLDGVRAFWNGQAMISRQGLALNLPQDFSRRLPARPLDGELWLGRGQFEATAVALRRSRPEAGEWARMRYMLFELPEAEGSFEQRAGLLRDLARELAWDAVQALRQSPGSDVAALRAQLAQVLQDGGEGLMLHRADAPYLSGRSEVLLKLKPQDDDEAVVLAHLPGTGRLAGLMGALRVRNGQGQEFSLGTGFSDAQRRLPPAVGSVVTYRYRGLTATGLPRFASFVRVQPL